MATRIKPTRKSLYQDDFYVWTRRQAECLRGRRYDELDLENLIEEVAELGDTLKKSARSRARTIMEHLLKLQHSPAVGPRAGWRDTIRTQRDDLLDDLTPTLRRELEQELDELTPVRVSGRRGRCATTAIPRPPTPCPRPAPTTSTRSPAIGFRECYGASRSSNCRALLRRRRTRR